MRINSIKKVYEVVLDEGENIDKFKQELYETYETVNAYPQGNFGYLVEVSGVNK